VGNRRPHTEEEEDEERTAAKKYIVTIDNVLYYEDPSFGR
jgi:hypothetical protein